MKKIFCYFGVLLVLAACTFHGVDPSIPYRYAELTATVTPTLPDEVDVTQLTPLPGEVGVDEPTVVPTNCDVVKGNINAKGVKIYFVPGQVDYNRVKIDTAKGERFFCTAEEAQAAGFRAALK